MNYRESFYFIAKCLTIPFSNNNRNFVKKCLQTKNIDWDIIIKISTNQLILCALYQNLMKEDLLKHIPKDLVEYMKHLTTINYERNLSIIDQAKEINSLLKANNITPIFIKGTGNLFSGIYDNIAERMISDIDFIVSKEEFQMVIEILKKNGYYNFDSFPDYFPYRHYPRLAKKNRIASVEVHKDLIIDEYTDEFNYDIVKSSVKKIGGVCILSNLDSLYLSIISTQINDEGFYYNQINLRNAYDIFLNSKKINTKISFNSFVKINYPLECFIALCNEVFGDTKSLSNLKTKKTKIYVNKFKSLLMNKKKAKKFYLRKKKYLYFKFILNLFIKSIFLKNYRIWFYKRLVKKIF